MLNLEYLIKEFEYIKKYGYYCCRDLKNILSLKEIEEEIQKTKKLRNELLIQIKDDINNKIKNKRIKNLTINIDKKDLCSDGTIKLLYTNSQKTQQLYLSKNDIFMAKDNLEVDKLIKFILPYLKGVFVLDGNLKTTNLVNKYFYIPTNLPLYNNLGKILISGDGIYLSEESIDKLSLTDLEKYPLIFPNLSCITKSTSAFPSDSQ